MLTTAANLGISTPLRVITKAQAEKINSRNQRLATLSGQNPQELPRAVEPSYPTSKRGILCEKNQETNLSKILHFQFNPETISDVKSNNYSTKQYSGFTFVDDIWASGGSRIISFKLQFEATAGFVTPFFGKSASYGQAQLNRLDELFPRGTLDYVELLQSFQYPRALDPLTPVFSNGGFIPSPKFLDPPIVIFAYGNYYLEGRVRDLSITHSLVNANLIPIRSEVDVTFAVGEERLIPIKDIAFPTSVLPTDTDLPNSNPSIAGLA